MRLVRFMMPDGDMNDTALRWFRPEGRLFWEEISTHKQVYHFVLRCQVLIC
jgi:hypothetical protein